VNVAETLNAGHSCQHVNHWREWGPWLINLSFD